jgi:NitT/TauT family transport system substrate-binding protein
MKIRSARIVLALIVFVGAWPISRHVFAQATRLTVSYSAPTANNSPIWIAKERGFLSKHGLDVQLLFIESGTTTIQALIAGETQIAQVAGTVVVSSALAGADVVAIGGLENRIAFSLVTQKDIKTPEQLKAKRLAISRFGSASDLGARLFLQRLGLTADKDVTLVQVGGTNTRLAAISKGVVESTVLTPEFYLFAKKSGFNTLADPVTTKIDFPQNGIATTRSFLKSKPEIVKNYLLAVIEAIHFFKTRQEESMQIMSKYLKITDREALEEIYKLYREILQPLPLPTPSGMQTLLDWMAQRDPKAKDAKPEQFLDMGPLREIEKSGYVAKLYQNK